MKESLVKLNAAAKELVAMLALWDLWTRLYVPQKTSWLRITIEGYGGANLHFGLTKEEVEKLAPVISEILGVGVKKAECSMADASFERSFPPEGSSETGVCYCVFPVLNEADKSLCGDCGLPIAL